VDKELFKDLLVGTYIRIYRERPTATKLIKKIFATTSVEVSHETARKWLMGTSVPSLELVLILEKTFNAPLISHPIVEFDNLNESHLIAIRDQVNQKLNELHRNNLGVNHGR
jgi:hypothetical protein